MKPLTVFLCIMVTLSLAFSIAAFTIVTQNNGLFTPNNSPSTTSSANNSPTNPPTNNPTTQYTNNPTPKPTPQTKITITPTETNKENLTNGKTRVTYTVTATYTQGSTITIHYSDFSLQLFVTRAWVYTVGAGEATPTNSGVFTLGTSHTTETFQLTFEFPSMSDNGRGDKQSTEYYFCYMGMKVYMTTP